MMCRSQRRRGDSEIGVGRVGREENEGFYRKANKPNARALLVPFALASYPTTKACLPRFDLDRLKGTYA